MKNTKLFFKTVIISACCCVVFVAAGYYYLSQNFNQAEIKTESVPYAQESPDNAGVMFSIGEEKTFLYLDFEKKALVVSAQPETDDGYVYGYPVNYSIECGYNLIVQMVDYVGGIELTVNEQSLRYTGIQAADIITTSFSIDFKKAVIRALCDKIAINGIGADFLVTVIENSKTDLTLPDCYYWKDYLSELCENLQMIDN